MFIRQTQTNSTATGEKYITYRLVRSERIQGKVRQITVLNLGRHFPIKQDDWPLLCSRIEQLLQPQQGFIAIQCSDLIEKTAQRYVGQLVARALPLNKAAVTPADAITDPAIVSEDASTIAAYVPDFQEVDVNSLEQSQPRSVGVEHCALHAISQIGLVEKLIELGISTPVRSAILANLIGRMAAPASERATWDWLQTQSSLGELIEVDFQGMSHMSLYRASDMLMKHRTEIETHVFNSIKTLFDFDDCTTLFDLTNTYFEGEVPVNPKAKYGRSKEKRTDCPLVTLGLVLSGSGFVRRSQTFAGNVAEGSTLQVMLNSLSAPPGALVIMDAGIASEANLLWLSQNGYHYLVVQRGGKRKLDPTDLVKIETASGEPLQLQKEMSADGKEALLYCYSAGRDAKETAMFTQFSQRFEAGLKKIADGLDKPRAQNGVNKINERIGRLKQKSRGASQHYTIDIELDASGKKVKKLTWEKKLVDGTMATHPGVYCLRSNELDWDAERMWRTYSMLTDLESVFRSLKSELGLRPVFHSKEERTDGHLFITVLAYQCVQVLRTQLKEAGINQSWEGLRKTLSIQQRVTASQRRKDGKAIHVRKSTVAEPALRTIYQALNISTTPGGTKKLIV